MTSLKLIWKATLPFLNSSLLKVVPQPR